MKYIIHVQQKNAGGKYFRPGTHGNTLLRAYYKPEKKNVSTEINLSQG